MQLLPPDNGKETLRSSGIPEAACSSEAALNSEAINKPARRRDLDRLRLLACLSTFFYHSIQVFDLNPYYHLKSITPSPTLDVAARLLHVVRMPLFFLIAGIVGFMAIDRLSNRQIAGRRALRLLPPFLIGVVFFTPGIKYFELLDGRFISWSGFIAWDGVMPEPLVFLRRYYAQMRWFSWSHMWFLFYLFLLSILLLPLLRRIAATGWTTRIPAALTLSVPLFAFAAVELWLRPIFPAHIPNLFWDWASMAVYVIVLLCGAALVQWPLLEKALQRWTGTTFVLAALGIYLYLGFDDWPFLNIGRALTLWGVLCLAIGLGPWISRGRIVGERYLSEAALPLYVLHHLPLIVIAFHVKDLPWPVWQRYGVIVLGAFVVTVAAYHVLIRPFDTMRLVFGMSPRAARRGPGEMGASTSPGSGGPGSLV